MSKFDTHGGYFAPKDYMRINEGGSHAENPNGGVQIGVDEHGIPNMLEEGEPVYKDYVYSDNIKASERFLDANHIPVKYKGMLYSEIADDLFGEAEERPNDPVSRNGLEAMLGRLADAQEQQKQDSERRKLERELSKLSPEELEALQQELMAVRAQAQPQEQMPMPEQQVMPEEQAVMEQPVEQMPVEQQVPMMANGGFLRTFDRGGYSGGGHSGARVQLNMENPNLMTPGLMEWVVPGAKGAKVFKSAAEIGKYLIGKYGHDAASLTSKVRDLEAAKVAAEKTLKEVSSMKTPYKSVDAAKRELRIIGQQLDKFKKGAKEAEELTAALNASQTASAAPEVVEAANQAKNAAETANGLRKSMKGAGTILKTVGKAVVEPGSLLKTIWNPTSRAGKAVRGFGRVVGDGAYYQSVGPIVGNAINEAFDNSSSVTEDFSDFAGVDLIGPVLENTEACGGHINKFDDGGDTDPYTGEIKQGKKPNAIQRYLSDHPAIGHRVRKAGVLAGDLARILPYSSALMDMYDSKRIMNSGDDSQRGRLAANASGFLGRYIDIGSKLADAAGGYDSLGSELLPVFDKPWLKKALVIPDMILDSKKFIKDFSEPVENFSVGGDINKFDGETNRTGQMSRNQFASDIDALRDIINYEQPELSLPFNVGQSMTDARTGFLKGIPATSVGTNPYETGPVYSGTDFNEFLKWLAAYNGSRNAGHLKGTYAPDQKFNYGEYGNIKALEASAPYTTFTNDIINAINGDDPDAKALALRYLQAYNAALPESARGKIVDANGNLVDGWQRQYEKVRTYQPGVGHLSGNFQDMLLAYKAQNAIGKDKQDAIDRSKKAPAVDIASYIQPPVEESVDEELPDGAPLPPAAAPNSGRASGPYFPTLPRYAGAFGAGLLAAYDAFTPADRYTATRYAPYVPVGHIDLQDQRYDPVDQNMIQNQMLAQGNSTQRALRNSGLGPSTGAAILAADNNTTRNLGMGFLQVQQANNQQRNGVIAANNQAEGMRAQFDYGVDAVRQRALNEAQIRNAQNDLMIQRLNYDAESQKYNALSNQLNAGLNALAGIGRENFARNQANSNTTLEGYKALGAGIGAHLPYYDIPVIYSALGGYLKKIKK